MTNEELDEFRRLLVAFEDAAVWCEQLGQRTRELIEGIQRHQQPAEEKLTEHLKEVTEMLRYVQDERRMVAAIRARVGLPPAGV